MSYVNFYQIKNMIKFQHQKETRSYLIIKFKIIPGAPKKPTKVGQPAPKVPGVKQGGKVTPKKK